MQSDDIGPDARASGRAMTAPTPSPAVGPRRRPSRRQFTAHQYAALIDFAPDATIVTDDAGVILLVNRQTETLFGYTCEALVGQPVELLMPQRFHATHRLHRDAYAAAPHTRPMGEGLRLVGRRQDGSEFPAEVSLAPLQAGDDALVIATLRDVSETQRVQAANRELHQLLTVTDTALAHLELDELLPELLARVRDVMEVDNVVLLLVAEDKDLLVVRATNGLPDDIAAAMRVPIGAGFAGRVAATRAPLAVEDLTTFPVFSPPLRDRPGIKSAAGVPLVLGKQLLGVLHVGVTRPRRFTEHEMRLLERVAERVAVAIERAQVYAAEQQAHAQATARTKELEAVLGGITDAVAVLDSKGHITYVNGAYRAMFALDARPDFAQMSASERAALFHARTVDGEPLPADQLAGARLLRGEALSEAASPDFILNRLDGRPMTVRAAGSPLRDAAGSITGAVLVMRDVTAERRLQRDTRELAAQLQATLDAMSDAVLLYDPAGHVLRLNAAAQALVGAEPAFPSVAGTAWWDRIQRYHPQRPDGSPLPFEEWPMARVLRGETLTAVDAQDVVLTDAQGHEQVLSYVGGPARAADGQLVGYAFVIRDVTASKRMERANAEQSEQLNRIFEGITDGVVVYDAAGHVVRTNAAARQLLGLDAAPATYGQLDAPERAVLFEARDDQDQPLAPKDWPLIRVLQGQVGTEGEGRDVRLRMLDSREVDVHTSAAPLHDSTGRLLGAVTVLHDQTERRRLEEARASELALREVNERLDTFATIAAHDLRSPLAATRMAVERAQRLLQRAAEAGAASDGEPQARAVAQAAWAMGLAGQSLDRLWRLDQQLLDLSRVKEGTLVLNRQQVDLGALVRACVAEQQLLNEGRTIAVRLPTSTDGDGEPMMVDADPERLSQVVTNFLTNAVRYAPDDQPIEVSVQVGEPTAGSGGGREARVAVRDHGPGIAPDEQANIWGRFQRARSISEAKGGLGLGLYIARTLIELHGGQVGVESTLGEGATFWFTLPLS